jgi:hypothetical protein
MSNVTIGVFETDSRIHYIDDYLAIIDYPSEPSKTLITFRTVTNPTLDDWIKVDKALKRIKATPTSKPKKVEKGWEIEISLEEELNGSE